MKKKELSIIHRIKLDELMLDLYGADLQKKIKGKILGKATKKIITKGIRIILNKIRKIMVKDLF